MTRILSFLRKYVAYHGHKPIPIDKKQLNKFCLKSVSCTGNELAGDDVENCENSQLTPTNLSHLSFCISQS